MIVRLQRSKKLLPLLAVILLFLAVFLYRNASGKSTTIPNTSQSSYFGQQSKFWSERIDKVGPQRAYEEFKDMHKDDSGAKPRDSQHLLAHLFGELLYQKVGLDAVGVCDDAFLHGCHHSYFGSAISDKGIDIVNALDEACIKKWGTQKATCQGGIGHGILSYLGHDNLEKALVICKTLTWKKPTSGCTGGVFSEYFFIAFENHQVVLPVKTRPLDKNNPYTPCTFLSKEYLLTCYYELPTWWEVVYENDYEKIGVLCDGVKDLTQKEYCFMGLGHVIGPSTNYDVAETIGICQKMSTREAVLLCRAGGSRSFVPESANKKHLADSVCGGLSESDRAYCLRMRSPMSEPDVF